MAKKKQETLVLFPEVLDITQKFTDEQFGALMRAAFAYRLNGEAYSGEDVAVDVAFRMISNQIDRYQERCETLANNAKGSKDEQKAAKNQQEEAKPQQSDPPIQSISISNPCPIQSSNSGIEADKPPTRRRFKPPTLEEVREYVTSRNSPVDPQGFIDFYASKGWMVGKTPMKDWKAACRNAESWDRWAKKGACNGKAESKPLWTVGTVV